MHMSKEEYILIKKLVEDPTFIQWAKRSDRQAYEYWETWITNHPDQKEWVDRARIIAAGIEFMPREISEAKVEKELEKLYSSIQSKKGSHVNSGWINILGRHWRIAASIAVLLATGLFGGYQMYIHGEQVYHTDYGERREIALSDGTQVVMNANSTLKFIRKYPRDVRMEGEVFFRVRKKPETGEKFSVKTSDLQIEVLGTVFNVNTRREKTEVLLEEGTVRLTMPETDGILMKPGELVSYSVKTRELVQQNQVKTDVVTSWKDGILLFDNTPLREALSLLESTYNIKVEYENETIAEKILVGGIPIDNLELCLKTLRNIYDLKIERNADTIVIR